MTRVIKLDATELKFRLGKYLSHVKNGGQVIVTVRGKDTAIIQPLNTQITIKILATYVWQWIFQLAVIFIFIIGIVNIYSNWRIAQVAKSLSDNHISSVNLVEIAYWTQTKHNLMHQKTIRLELPSNINSDDIDNLIYNCTTNIKDAYPNTHIQISED